MKRMLTSLSVMAVLAVVAVSAMAQYPGPDSIGIYTSTDGPTAETSMSTTVPFEEIEIYVCITNPTSAAVSGWEGNITYDDGLTAAGISLTAGANLFSPTLDKTFEQFVGIGPSPLALEPNGSGVVHVATITAFIQTTTTVAELAFEAFTVPSLPGWDGPVYTDGIDVGDIKPLFPSTGGAGVTAFRVNGATIPADETTTWGEMKGLFN